MTGRRIRPDASSGPVRRIDTRGDCVLHMSLFGERLSGTAGDGEGDVGAGTTTGYGVAARYVQRTGSRHEKRVEERLRAHGIEPFLPQVARWRHWKDRRTLVASRLSSEYCFARFALADRVAVLSNSAVAKIVGNPRARWPFRKENSRRSVVS